MDKDNVLTVKWNEHSTLKFLDIASYVSPGINYANCSKAYDVKENKGYFPYQWFDDLNKLERASLPPHETFYSSLKQANITNEEYKFCQSIWTEIP